MPAYAVLLRGVNVGGHRRLPMAELRAALIDAGFTGVETYVQSGNVTLASDHRPAGVAATVEGVLAERFGLDDVPVVVRAGTDLARIVALDPLAQLVTEPKRYQVSFLAGAADRGALADLREGDFAPERVHVEEREIYSWHPDGVHGSRLARLLTDRRLGTVVTARNWATVCRLREMIAGSRAAPSG